jgi:hypothetical protein
MNDLIPFKIRLLAAGLHAIFAVPMGSFLLFIVFILVSENSTGNYSIFGLIAIDFFFYPRLIPFCNGRSTFKF